MINQKKFVEVAEQLISSGYCYLPFPIYTSIPMEIYRGFNRLLDEDIVFKKKCTFNTKGTDEPNEGLVVRKGSQVHPDFKAYWHYTPGLDRFFSNNLKVRYTQWLEKLSALYKTAHHHSIALAIALDTVTSEQYSFADNLIDAQMTFKSMLRVNKYYRQPLDRDLATSHVDKSLFTFRLHSTHENLFVKKEFEECKVHPPEGHILVLTGNEMASITGGTFVGNKRYEKATIEATSYRVKNTEDTVQNSILFFAHTDLILPYE